MFAIRPSILSGVSGLHFQLPPTIGRRGIIWTAVSACGRDWRKVEVVSVRSRFGLTPPPSTSGSSCATLARPRLCRRQGSADLGSLSCTMCPKREEESLSDCLRVKISFGGAPSLEVFLEDTPSPHTVQKKKCVSLLCCSATPSRHRPRPSRPRSPSHRRRRASRLHLRSFCHQAAL
jgi:hypothetical protein